MQVETPNGVDKLDFLDSINGTPCAAEKSDGLNEKLCDLLSNCREEILKYRQANCIGCDKEFLDWLSLEPPPHTCNLYVPPTENEISKIISPLAQNINVKLDSLLAKLSGTFPKNPLLVAT